MNPNQNNPDTPDTASSNTVQPSVELTTAPAVTPVPPTTPEALADAQPVSSTPDTSTTAVADTTMPMQTVDEPIAPVTSTIASVSPVASPTYDTPSDQPLSGSLQSAGPTSAETTTPAQPETPQVPETVTEDHGKPFGIVGFVLIAVGILIGGLVAFLLISNNA